MCSLRGLFTGSRILLVEVLHTSAVTAHLHTDKTIPFGYELLCIRDNFLRIATISMGVDRCCLTAFAAQQLVNRHVRQLALNIPQGHVHPGDGIVQHRAITMSSIRLTSRPIRKGFT